MSSYLWYGEEEEEAPTSPPEDTADINGRDESKKVESPTASKVESFVGMIRGSRRSKNGYKKVSKEDAADNGDTEEGDTPESNASGWTTPEEPQSEPILAPLAQMGVALQAEDTTLTAKAQVYYVHAKDEVVEIIATIGNTFVFIKAKMCEITLATKGSTLAYAEQARLKFQAKTIWIQDGYVYIKATIDGKVAIVKAKTSEVFDFAKAKAIQGFEIIGEYTAPVKARATAVKDSVASSRPVAIMVAAKERAILAAQRFKPYYMKVHNGIVHIVAKIGNTVVVIQAKTADIFRSIQVRAVESVAEARAAIRRFTGPYVSRVMRFGDECTNKFQYFKVSIKNGVLSIVGAIDARTVYIRTKVSEVLDIVRARTTNRIDATKEAVSVLTAKISELVSSAYGQASSNVKLIYTRTNDGFVYIACQVNERTLAFRIKLAEIVKYLCSVPLGLYDKSRAAIVDGYSLARVKVLEATEFTRAKSLEVTANVRSLAGKQENQVTAASAAGGAIALGAGGGAAGLCAGGGAGLVLAPFTFGLSIPVGATAGLVIGGTAGGTAGFVAGGAAGRGAYKHKDEIGNSVNGAKSKVKGYRALAAASTIKLCAKVRGSTGGAVAA